MTAQRLAFRAVTRAACLGLHASQIPGRFWLCVRYLVSNAEAVRRKKEKARDMREPFLIDPLILPFCQFMAVGDPTAAPPPPCGVSAPENPQWPP